MAVSFLLMACVIRTDSGQDWLQCGGQGLKAWLHHTYLTALPSVQILFNNVCLNDCGGVLTVLAIL